MKAFVIMFNRLTSPKKLCRQLVKGGCEVILIDNGSTYQPLLKWYKDCPYKVHLLKEGGHKSLWESGIINEYSDRYYIVTDHDLDLTGVPKDFISVLMKGFENPNIVKSGLSLRIDDLPDNEYTKEVIEWESRFWKTRQDNNGFYFSDIDTTLAIYDRERMPDININQWFSAVRSPAPYSARHLPWYNEEPLSNEENYYFKLSNGMITSSVFLDLFK